MQLSCKPCSCAIETYLDIIHEYLRVLGSDEERQFEGTAMDQTKAVPLETSTPLNAWLLTSALSTSTLPCHLLPKLTSAPRHDLVNNC